MKFVARELFYASNLLSIARILVVPPLAYSITIDTPGGDRVVVVLALFAIVTDFLDGYTARRLDQRTELGRALDPLADKIAIVVVAIFLVVYRDFPAALVVLLAHRDLLILLMGSIASRNAGRVMEANIWGKANSCVIAAAILLFLFGLRGVIVNALVVAGYATILVSGVAYYRRGEPYLVSRVVPRYALRTAVAVATAGMLAVCAYYRLSVLIP